MLFERKKRNVNESLPKSSAIRYSPNTHSPNADSTNTDSSNMDSPNT